MTEIAISGDSIPLGAFLKLAGAIDSGGDAKRRITSGDVTVNGEQEIRRGRKLVRGDVVGLDGAKLVLV